MTGTKRKPEADPSPKRDRKAPKTQATLEESGITNEDSEMKDASDHKQTKPDAQTELAEVKWDDKDAKNGESKKIAADDDMKEDANDNATEHDKTDDDAKPESNEGGAVEKSTQRARDMPSNILEKGLIYFFTRNRVGVDDADSVGDLQRTFFVLRPLPFDAKLGDGAIPDLKNNRLFALPKKTFPKSHNDRFMAFVEKANTSIQDLKDNFCKVFPFALHGLGIG